MTTTTKQYTDDDIKIISTSYHKKMTDRGLAQVNFTALIPRQMWGKYNTYTSKHNKNNMGRLRNMEIMHIFENNNLVQFNNDNSLLVFGRVSHGYGYDITQDIYSAIEYTKMGA